MRRVDYNKLKIKARDSIYLYHYTTKEAAELIKNNQSLRLTNLGNARINDEVEGRRIKSIWKDKVYVVCFTNTLSNQEYFKKMYGAECLVRIKLDTLMLDRLFYDSECVQRIDFVNRSDINYKNSIDESERYSLQEDWGYRTSELLCMEYVDDISEYILEDGFEANAGIIKQRCGKWRTGETAIWEEEQEVRVRVALRPKYFENYRSGLEFITPNPLEAANIEYIYISLNKVEYDIKAI